MILGPVIVIASFIGFTNNQANNSVINSSISLLSLIFGLILIYFSWYFVGKTILILNEKGIKYIRRSKIKFETHWSKITEVSIFRTEGDGESPGGNVIIRFNQHENNHFDLNSSFFWSNQDLAKIYYFLKSIKKEVRLRIDISDWKTQKTNIKAIEVSLFGY
jgi:hypothetical protein